MESDISLEEFANRPKIAPAWVDALPDELFNQLYDGIRSGSVGKATASLWLQSLGYADATAGKVMGVMSRARR